MHMRRDGSDIKYVTQVLAALTDPTRLRLVRLLFRQELCVCELVDALRMPQYKVSRHLRTLRAAGLVEARRNGRWMHYRISQRGEVNGLHMDLLKVLDHHLAAMSEIARDDDRLSRRLALRRAGQCVVGVTGVCSSGGKGRAAGRQVPRRAASRQRNSRGAHKRATG